MGKKRKTASAFSQLISSLLPPRVSKGSPLLSRAVSRPGQGSEPLEGGRELEVVPCVFGKTQGLPRKDWLLPGAQVSGRADKAGASGLFSWLVEPLGTRGLGLVGAPRPGQGGECHGESPAFGSAWVCRPGSRSRLSCRSRLCLTFAESGQEIEGQDRQTWRCCLWNPASCIPSWGWASLKSVGGT